MKQLVFSNNGILSQIDITTMGDSIKRSDGTKIGQFDSGLKYAIAILLRNDVKFYIKSGDNRYEFNKIVEEDPVTKKAKTLIEVANATLIGNEIQSIKKVTTAFAVNLGYDWEFWMAIRELYSNCLDEDGVVGDSYNDNYETNIVINVNDQVQDVLDNFDNYFFTGEYIYSNNKDVKIAPNTLHGQPFTIYKNGIQVYCNPDKKSKYVYDHRTAELDEMRVIRNRSSTEMQLSYAIRECEDESFIKDFLNEYDHDLYDSRLCGYGRFSDEWVNVVNIMYQNEILPTIHPEMFNDMAANSRFIIGKKRITNSDHWLAPKIEIDVVKPDLSIPVELTFEENVKLIASNHKINVTFPIFEAAINSSIQVVADLDNECLYVNSTFSKKDLWQLLKQIYRLEKKSSDDIWEDYVTLLNK